MEKLTKLKSVIAFFCLKSKNELSTNRLLNLLYLADWYSALLEKKQMTELKYKFRFQLSSERFDSVLYYPMEFKIKEKKNSFNVKIKHISYIGSENQINLTDREIEILTVIINKTNNFYYNDLINYIYSTYPFQQSTMYINLNLIESAKEYHLNNKT